MIVKGVVESKVVKDLGNNRMLAIIKIVADPKKREYTTFSKTIAARFDQGKEVLFAVEPTDKGEKTYYNIMPEIPKESDIEVEEKSEPMQIYTKGDEIRYQAMMKVGAAALSGMFAEAVKGKSDMFSKEILQAMAERIHEEAAMLIEVGDEKKRWVRD